jgi:hypothetical protein
VNGRAAWAAVLAAWLTANAFAHEEALRAQVEQKIRLSARLLGDQATAQRIIASGHLQAVAHLDEARVHQSLAEDRLARGDDAGARQAADEALRHLGHARRLVPDAPARQAAARARHEQQLASVERLLESWRARAGGDGQALTDAIGVLGQARALAQEQRYEEAQPRLAQAQRLVLEGLSRTLGSTTLDYTPRPATPAEEFQQELARQRSLAELVPLAVHDLKPRPDALALVERYAETGQTLRAQALQRFEQGATTEALTHIRSATLYLQRALLAAGLVVPPSTGNPP